ncbi:hypothetical protein [Mitsuaria sp. GD03876]|uniref:hypothetical protein n=1 Tax=Mitsuaria sp. GD03876 TaxID=2975399 RepID=UPI0024493E8E|nr:hypothetical protein [Mitsuaria sp. GD03876]MDH0863152.1 hypothetical protein [Mitsuaria sp. GD03876]
MPRVYVSDTNIWIDFRNAGLLDELFRLPFILCCTDFVLHELEDLAHEDLIRRGLTVESLDGDAITELLRLSADHNNSSLADVSCYFLARRTGLPLLTGDGRLRKQAQKDGMTVHGALWLLDQLLAHGVVDEAALAAGLERMLTAGARFPADECERRLKAWAA